MPERRNRTGKPGGQKRNHNPVKTGATRSDRALLHDKRTREAKTILYIRQVLGESLGGDLSAQEQIIVDRVSFKVLRCSLIEEELTRYNDAPEYLTKYYLQWTNSLREDLKTIGLERRAKEVVPRLEDYLREKYSDNGEVQPTESKL